MGNFCGEFHKVLSYQHNSSCSILTINTCISGFDISSKYCVHMKLSLRVFQLFYQLLVFLATVPESRAACSPLLCDSNQWLRPPSDLPCHPLNYYVQNAASFLSTQEVSIGTYSRQTQSCSVFPARDPSMDPELETCFWDALDGYAKTWLPFVFPVYIMYVMLLWLIIIWLSRCYVLTAKLCSSTYS